MDNTNNTNNRSVNKPYIVSDEMLLYKLSDAGLLDRLCKVAPNKFVEGKRVWFFDYCREVWTVIKQFKVEHKEDVING